LGHLPSEDRWPPHERFPLNEDGRRVETVVAESFRQSKAFTIVTGYTSLEHLLSFFTEYPIEERTVDIVLGSEPTRGATSTYTQSLPIDRQARSYWLERGVSVLTGGGIVRLLEAIDAGHVRFFEDPRLHAKIYLGEEGAVVGSSNFSNFGFRTQREANFRAVRGSHEYQDLTRIAHRFKRESRECTDPIRSLLEDLLQLVTWQEALARAISELLDGAWIERYPAVFQLLKQQNLWPHQEQAVAQGLWILDTRGGLLVADATGSGKTRVGTHLLYGLLNRIWSQGQGHRSKALVVCPPSVVDNWTVEIQESEASSVTAVSHGKLSLGLDKDRIQTQVQRSNILFLDEAHNYLTTQSERSQTIASSVADYVTLLTATPMNRGPKDLLRMIELLGLDNLSDREFHQYRDLRRQSNLTMKDARVLKDMVGQYTIRRTKHDLNQWVDRHPEGYLDATGKECRYPEHTCIPYETGETTTDQDTATTIVALASKLRGLLWLRSLQPPGWAQHSAEKQAQWLEGRTRGAKGLATYAIRTALQSSKAALLEVVYGTRQACDLVGLDQKLKDPSGNHLETTRTLLSAPSEIGDLCVPVPDWLRGDGLKRAVQQEIEVLSQIGEEAKTLSSARDEARVDLFLHLAQTHDLFLAFDKRPITLRSLEDQLTRQTPHDVVVADGSLSSQERSRIVQTLGLEGTETGVIALCSDAMSEGINLQRASAVVLLDTPSVIRIAEQRVGRIDRMDSPHEEIKVYWPNNSPAFQTSMRDLLLERHDLNGQLLGNNIKLPEEIFGSSSEDLFDDEAHLIGVSKLIDEYQTHQQVDDNRLEDAFHPVRTLVAGLSTTDVANPSAGASPEAPPLISSEQYEAVAGMDANVWSRVSIVQDDERWAFFCIRATDFRAPRWVLLQEGGEKTPGGLGLRTGAWRVTTELRRITHALRSLIPHVEPLDMQAPDAILEKVQPTLETMMDALLENEKALLSNKARHALHLMQKVLGQYVMAADRTSPRHHVCQFLKRQIQQPRTRRINLHDAADRWLGIVHPRYVELRQQAGSRSVLRLEDLYEPLIDHPIATPTLRTLAESVAEEVPMQQRLAAAIFALPMGG